MSQWFYEQGGQRQGPLSETDLRALFASGSLSPSSLVWTQGFPEWKRASDVPGLTSPPPGGPPPSGFAAPPPAPAPFSSPLIPSAHSPAISTHKQQYLARIRADSAYPTYRGFIGVLAILGYILAGVYGLIAVIAGLSRMGESFFQGIGLVLVGFVVAAIMYVGARFWKEAALILADIADSITEANSRDR